MWDTLNIGSKQCVIPLHCRQSGGTHLAQCKRHAVLWKTNKCGGGTVYTMLKVDRCQGLGLDMAD